MRDYEINSDLKQSNFQNLKFVQYDNGSMITVNVFEDSKAVDLTGCTVLAKYKRADGQEFNRESTVTDNKIVTTLDSTVTAVVGVLKIIFKITYDNSNKQASTFIILADVKENFGEGDSGNIGGNTGGNTEINVDLSTLKLSLDGTDLVLKNGTTDLSRVTLPTIAGKNVELQSNGTYIQYRYEGDTDWTNLVALSSLKGADGDTGLSAYELAQEQGFAGNIGQWLQSLVPNLQIGTVETLGSGSSATASITGTIENPLLNLGIPKGADGAGGTGGSSEKEWELLHTIEITEETTYIHQDINPTKENILIIYEDVWSNVTGSGFAIAINGLSCGSNSTSASEGSFVNSESYKSKGFIIIEKLPVGFMVQFGGKNSGGNEGNSPKGSAHYLNDENSNNLNVINHIMFSLDGYASKHIMGGTFKIYGR